MISPYEKKGREIGKLVAKKNLAYGNSFEESGKILKILYPEGIPSDQYDEMLGIVRVIDKLFRLVNNKFAFDESPWDDVVGYGILGSVRLNKKPKGKTS
jgi:hypothetical protein